MTYSVLDHPSWHQIHQGCSIITQTIIQYEKSPPTMVAGVVRGGLIPATIISHILNDIPVIPLMYSSKTGRGDNKTQSNILPKIENETLLILDDIIDSGNSMLEIINHFKQFDVELVISSLYYKEEAAVTPDYYMEKIPVNGPWITMPWET